MIIALAGQKGGSFKSTTAIAIACELQARGFKVLLVDADPQGTARTFGQVAASTGNTVPTVVGMGVDLYKPHQLPTLAESFDYTVLDTPPRRGDVQKAALAVANMAVLPCGPSAADAWALTESIDLVNEAKTLRPDLKAAVLITRKVARTVLANSAREILSGFGLPILKTELGFRIAYQESLAAGKGAAQYAPNDVVAEEVRALTDEILSEE